MKRELTPPRSLPSFEPMPPQQHIRWVWTIHWAQKCQNLRYNDPTKPDLSWLLPFRFTLARILGRNGTWRHDCRGNGPWLWLFLVGRKVWNLSSIIMYTSLLFSILLHSSKTTWNETGKWMGVQVVHVKMLWFHIVLYDLEAKCRMPHQNSCSVVTKFHSYNPSETRICHAPGNPHIWKLVGFPLLFAEYLRFTIVCTKKNQYTIGLEN